MRIRGFKPPTVLSLGTTLRHDYTTQESMSNLQWSERDTGAWTVSGATNKQPQNREKLYLIWLISVRTPACKKQNPNPLDMQFEASSSSGDQHLQQLGVAPVQLSLQHCNNSCNGSM